jgi:glutamate-1-semialdehyde aminotransferase
LARIFSGARTVFSSGFHGWHDWHLQYRPHIALPDRDLDTLDFGYDLDRLSDLFREYRKVAAVIVTPEVNFFPPQFMVELETITHSAGALLIIDEVMTGFRYSAGGYHATCGIRPDIITISKGLANGVALSAVLGRADVVQAHEETYLGSTYQREVTPFAAALATLDEYRDGEPLYRIQTVGGMLMDGLNSIFSEKNMPARAFAVQSMFDIIFEDTAVGQRFCREMLCRGYLIQYGSRFMPSASTAERDVNDALDMANRAVDTIMKSKGVDNMVSSSGDDGRRIPTLASLTTFAAENFAASKGTVQRWVAGATNSEN